MGIYSFMKNKGLKLPLERKLVRDGKTLERVLFNLYSSPQRARAVWNSYYREISQYGRSPLEDARNVLLECRDVDTLDVRLDGLLTQLSFNSRRSLPSPYTLPLEVINDSQGPYEDAFDEQK